MEILFSTQHLRLQLHRAAPTRVTILWLLEFGHPVLRKWHRSRRTSAPFLDECVTYEPIRNPYVVGNALALRLEDHSQVESSIIQVLSQFTLSCVVVVQLNHPRLQGQFALKLYDRVHASQLREDEEHLWTPEVESAYHEFVTSGQALPFFGECESKFKEDEFWADDEREGWTDGKREAYLQYLCWRTYDTERHAYHLLHELQGTYIPKVFDFPNLPDSAQLASAAASKFLSCPGILLQYIPGHSLTDLADWPPAGDWQDLCEEAIRVVRLVGQMGVCNRDVKPRNFIVRPPEESKGYQVVLLDFGLCYFRSQAKNDKEFREWQADEDEEGAVGRVMEKKLRGGFKYRRSSWSEALLDEFKRE